MASRIAVNFGQRVCGFDLLRAGARVTLSVSMAGVSSRTTMNIMTSVRRF